MDAREFVQIIRDIVRDETRGSTFALGTVDSGYVSGRPAILFDGETTTSTKTYPYLASYAPAADDRVLLAKVGGTWTILGEVV